MAERYGIWIPPCAMLKVVYRKAMNAWLVHSFYVKKCACNATKMPHW